MGVGDQRAGEGAVGEELEVAGGVGRLAVGVDGDGVVGDRGFAPGEDARVEFVRAVRVAEVGHHVLAVREEVEVQAVVVIVRDMQAVEENDGAGVGGVVEDGAAVAAEDAGGLGRKGALRNKLPLDRLGVICLGQIRCG